MGKQFRYFLSKFRSICATEIKVVDFSFSLTDSCVLLLEGIREWVSDKQCNILIEVDLLSFQGH